MVMMGDKSSPLSVKKNVDRFVETFLLGMESISEVGITLVSFALCIFIYKQARLVTTMVSLSEIQKIRSQH